MLQVETRKLAAIMFTDIVGFSRQMGADEAHLLRLLAVHNQLIERAVAEHHGQLIKSTGDGFLAEFPSVVHAVQCAQDVQIQFRTYNSEQEKAEQIHIRIGIHLGDIVVQPDGDVQGDGVNIAARLQPLAESDTICLSGKVYEEVEKKIPLGPVISLGRPKLKNIAQRFPVYLLVAESPQGVRQTLHAQRRMGRSEDALRMVEQALHRKPLTADNHLNSVGVAYYLAGRPEAAVAPLQQFLSHYRNGLGAHLTLAAVYSELGKEAEAQAEAAEVLRISPQFSLEVLKQRAPIKDPAVLERHVAALRKAGLR